MDWVFNHFQVLIAIAGAVAYWLNQRRLAKADEQVAPPKETTFDDPQLAERTRRIREEIQRKIEQRARGYTQPPPPVMAEKRAGAPPVIRPEAARPQPVTAKAAARLETQRNAEILEQQAALSEQLRQAVAMKAAALQRTQFETNLSRDETQAAAVHTGLREDLTNPDELRRAFVLREVLGPPVALRS